MKAFVIRNPNQAEIMDVPKPEPRADEVLIRVKASGFCGTDIHTFKGEHPSIYPLIPGHEFSGVIEKVGTAVTRFNAGEPVLADPNVFCESCRYCKQNKQIHCESLEVIGNTRSGAFAEYVTAPERCVFSAEGLNLIQGAMAEPLGCVINSHNKVTIPVGGNVLIYGAGTIGLMHLMLARRRGASCITVVDMKPAQLELASSLGATAVLKASPEAATTLDVRHPDGFAVVIDATGIPSVVEEAIRRVMVTGTFLAFGACPTESSIKINPFELYYRDLNLVGSYALQKTMPQSIAMLREGGLDLGPLVGDVITLDEMPDRFAAFVAGKTNNKIIVEFS